jgi:hypothetical protein
MTFPTPRATEVSSSGAVTNRIVDLPAGIVAGDLMVVIFEGSAGAGPVTPPAGWAFLAGGWGAGSPDGIWWKIAIGGETSATFVTTSPSGASVHCALAFQGAVGPPEYTFADMSGGSVMNCPAITPSWGLADTLFCAINYWSDPSDYPTAYPASYTLMQYDSSPSTVGFRTSARQLAATTDNPASQTASGNMILHDGVMDACAECLTP